MKPDVHPDYHPVVFQDANTGAQFVTRSTMTSSRTIDWETPMGVRTYPLVVVEVSSDFAPVLDGREAHPGHRGPGGEVLPALRSALEIA
jgi:large subunit ribosomal protein L31